MHYECKNEMNSNAYHNATMTSCTSPINNVNGNVAILHKNQQHTTDKAAATLTNTKSAAALNQEQQFFNKPDKRTNDFNIDNIINLRKECINSETTAEWECNDRVTQGQQQQQQQQQQSKQQKWPHSVSPTISVRSTTISIVSIDANAIDSSVVDSDSDCEAEGVHSNYVVKKLGQQTTYAPDSPDLPVINKGLKVISQTISPNGSNGLPTDSLSAQILNNGLSRPPTLDNNNATSQIGSIALTNSTDVTFGDKHFYEGPVTIQQFLIDSRDKWKSLDDDGQDNPIYIAEENGMKQDAAANLNSTSTHQNLPYKFIFNRKAVLITGTIILLMILIGVLIIVLAKLPKTTGKPLGDGDDSRKNIPINSTIGTSNIGAGKFLRIVARDGWLAEPPHSPPVPLDLPISRIIVIDTRTDICTTQAACTYRVRFIQTFNIESSQHDDIIYNFLIGGDGNVYEGRGWDFKGAHLKGFNDDSISFAYIGTFGKQKPSAKQMNVTKLLLEDGVKLKKLSPDYKIYSANKLDPTATATQANALYESFKDWPQWWNGP